MKLAWVGALCALLAGPANAAFIGFEGFDDLYYFDNGEAVQFESFIAGDTDTGRGSAFFELMLAGPVVDFRFSPINGAPLENPLTCHGNNTVMFTRSPPPPCFTTEVAFLPQYSLVIDELAQIASLTIYASTLPDLTAFQFGGADITRTVAVSIPTPGVIPLPASLVLVLSGLGALIAVRSVGQRRTSTA